MHVENRLFIEVIGETEGGHRRSGVGDDDLRVAAAAIADLGQRDSLRR